MGLRKTLARLILGDDFVDIDDHLRIDRQNEFWAKKVKKVSDDQQRLLMKNYKMREQLFQTRKIADIGRTALELSQVGVVVVDKDYTIINVNARACEYLGEEVEDVIGKTIDELEPESEDAAKYINFFFRQSERTRNLGRALQERTFTHEDNQFSIQGFYDVNEDSDFNGGYLFITPNKVIKSTRRRTVVAPVEALTRKTIVEYAEQLMNKSGTKVVDLATSSANIEALGQLYNYYKCFNNGRFIFQNISRFERDYLANLGVEENDIISLRNEPKPRGETGEYPAIQGSGI